MYEPNVQELLRRLKPADLVLDVGGWACPFNRAQWVLDAQPYETRGFYATFGGAASQGGEKEWFSKATWVVRDICDKAPYPFPDKFFDFFICSHTLEDLRDPLWVCQELMRVGKAGYIEIPSREWETIRNIERPGMAGLSHHRWLIDIHGTRIDFLQKMSTLHVDRRLSLPSYHLRNLTPAQRVQWLWWTNSFEFGERTIHGPKAQHDELANFVRQKHPNPFLLALDEKFECAREYLSRMVRGVRRRIPFLRDP